MDMISRMLKRSFATLLAVLALTGCGVSSRLSSKSPKSVTILSVNDMHASLDRLPRLAFMADSLRALYPSLLLVSAGDNQTGNPANDMYDPTGFPMIDLMNELGFAVSAVGNHEFDSGVLGFEYLSQQARFPFISANVIKPAGSPLNLSPYIVLTTKDGTRVTFFSLLDVVPETGHPASHPDKMEGFTFLEPLSLARKYDREARSTDIPVYLTHLGFEIDKKLAGHLDSDLYPLIIGGHSHTFVPKGTTENGVYITQAQSNLKYATLIQVQKDARGHYDIWSDNLPIDPKGNEDPEIRRKVNEYLDNPSLHKVVGRLSAPLRDKEQIGYLFTDALRDASGADFALANGGGIRVDRIPQGEVEVRDIYAADPFGNEGVVYDLTGRQIIDLLRAHWHGDKYKICYSSGLRIDYEAEHFGQKDEEVDIELYDLDGRSLDLDKVYSVAMNNYLSSTFLPATLPFRSLFTPTAEITLQYISKLKNVPSYDGRKLVTFEHDD